jgi:hypothetical protein
MPATEKRGLLERLEAGPLICAEGYLFEFERRGYLHACPFVPEVVIDHPDAVNHLREDFVQIGSDVVEVFTGYAHRHPGEINRQALRSCCGAWSPVEGRSSNIRIRAASDPPRFRCK